MQASQGGKFLEAVALFALIHAELSSLYFQDSEEI